MTAQNIFIFSFIGLGFLAACSTTPVDSHRHPAQTLISDAGPDSEAAVAVLKSEDGSKTLTIKKVIQGANGQSILVLDLEIPATEPDRHSSYVADIRFLEQGASEHSFGFSERGLEDCKFLAKALLLSNGTHKINLRQLGACTDAIEAGQDATGTYVQQ